MLLERTSLSQLIDPLKPPISGCNKDALTNCKPTERGASALTPFPLHGNKHALLFRPLQWFHHLPKCRETSGRANQTPSNALRANFKIYKNLENGVCRVSAKWTHRLMAICTAALSTSTSTTTENYHQFSQSINMVVKPYKTNLCSPPCWALPVSGSLFTAAMQNKLWCPILKH